MMKKIFILSALCLGFAVTNTNAQVFELEADTVTVTTAGLNVTDPNVVLDDAVTLYNHVNNVSGANLSGLKWQIIQSFDSANAPYKGWYIYTFCDNFICYTTSNLTVPGSNPVTYKEFTFADIADRARSDFKMQVVVPSTTPNGTVGVAKVRVWNSTQADTATFIVKKGNSNSIGVVKMNDNRVTVYPNPANGSDVTIFVNKDLKGTEAKIYNLLGAEMSAVKVSNELASVNTAAFAAGTYIVKIQNAMGEVIATRKLIKN
ncbi:hypothetical protein DBR32_02655 [Taibaiella sp. KBW10]|uniref:T9SS type A sorting domain-containing protein n=1 Tax=Taibaiella sp. KBW10 TaxID=2153357 RepID=UPI000F59A74E|nr:T9SS type A sorting domain-containing protein [Taibaiella sp. KBW10]RQO32520.1 hypothetical protein DBR32_02655 [Taibaiella sp. KBW10]